MNSTNLVIIGASATSNKNDSCSCCNPAPPVSMLTGIAIFTSAGMNLALGLGWSEYSYFGTAEHFRFSWFIGVIIGTILSMPLIIFIPKKFIMLASSLLILIEGIILTSVPYNDKGLLAGRYLNGIAIGLATVTFFMHSSEISRKAVRGACLAVEQYAITVGIAIQVIYISLWDATNTFPANRLHGILDIILAVLATSFVYFFLESPIDYLRKGNETEALISLARLELTTPENLKTRAKLEAQKIYVREQEDLTLMQNLKRGALPLIKMILFRSMMLAFTFSLPLSIALQDSLFSNDATWSPLVSACLRILGCFIAQLLVDNIGRKLPSLFCTAIIGALFVGIGAICMKPSNIADSHSMSIVTSLCLLIQFFAGFFAPFTSAYLGEAFPLKIKPYFMAVCVIVEQLIHIIVICTFGFIDSNVYLTEGILILIVFVALCVVIPETRKTSLTEAQEQFRHLLQLKFF